MRSFPKGSKVRIEMASGKAHEGVVQDFDQGIVDLGNGAGTVRIYLRWVEAIFPLNGHA